MQLTNKTQTEKNLDSLEKRVSKATLALAQTANALNDAYDCVWSLPDDQLAELLQNLVDNDRFEEVFNIHAQSAASVNALLDGVGYVGTRVKEGARREYSINNGVVSLVPLPEPEVIQIVEE